MISFSQHRHSPCVLNVIYTCRAICTSGRSPLSYAVIYAVCVSGLLLVACSCVQCGNTQFTTHIRINHIFMCHDSPSDPACRCGASCVAACATLSTYGPINGFLSASVMDWRTPYHQTISRLQAEPQSCVDGSGILHHPHVRVRIRFCWRAHTPLHASVSWQWIHAPLQLC